MTPQTVNAYYHPSMNLICFPAAILQPPFFDVNADLAVNYGAMGAVVGHEMTHGFDDQGSQYVRAKRERRRARKKHLRHARAKRVRRRCSSAAETGKR
jgi:putative endopeptidase